MNIFRFLNTFRVILVFAFVFVTELDFTDLSDPERKQNAIDKLLKLMKDEGIELPNWLQPYTELFVGAIVNLAVFLLKKLEFLPSGSEKLQA